MDRRRFLQGALTGPTALAAGASGQAVAAHRAKPAQAAPLKAGHQHRSSDADLRLLAALGVRHICSALPSRTLDESWSVGGLTRLDGDDVLFSNTSFIEPPAFYRFRAAIGETEKTLLATKAPVDYSGYEVIRIPMRDGHATGEYEDFLTGFVTPDGKVWGRPVGVTVGQDGSLFVSDDGTNTVWRVNYTGK